MLYSTFLQKTDPMRELNRIQHEIDRLFGAERPVKRKLFPPVNVWTNQDAAIISAELPGFDMKDVHLSIVGNELTMKGKREMPEMKDGEFFHRRERSYGEFERIIQLPFVVDHAKIEASLTDGVLKIALPRAESDKPINIEIKSN